MFKKPFRVKSNTQIKSSERKNLKDLLLKSFLALTDEDIDEIFPKKETASCMKIITSENITVQVYIVQKRPIAFEYKSSVYPSVYLLWKFQNLTQAFTTNHFVMKKIAGGADLMLPGVFESSEGLGTFPTNSVSSINTIVNKASIAVGITAMSSDEMKRSGGKGKCVIVYHYYGDHLCTIDDMPLLPLPQLGPPEWLIEPSSRLTPEIEEIEEKIQIEESEEASSSSLNETEEMDDLLKRCFLTAIKYSKKLELPMLTSTFYKTEVMSLCPDDKILDIKKSSYKKVGQFLKHMCKEGVIEIKEKKKGVETIESITKDHPMVREFYVEVENRPGAKVEKTEVKDESSDRNIVETYAITAAVQPIFKEFNLKKGDTLTKTEIKRHIVEYVKSHNYQNEESKRFVQVGEPHLNSIFKNEVMVTWEELMEKICSSMKPCFKVTTGTEVISAKGKLAPIVMTVQKRGGNKKVTLVDNLELYRIRITEFAKECQHGVAASTCISKPVGKKCEELLIQGNQVLFVYNLLVDKYKIPKKYIRGLEYAPKQKGAK